MCVRLGKSGSIRPGSYQVIKNRRGTQLRIYGFGLGSMHNARWEGINTTWKKLHDNRGIFQVESFWEGSKEFVKEDRTRFNIGVLTNSIDEFAILTVNSNPVVKPFHGRMPLCLSDEGVEQFLDGNDNVEQLPSGLFVINNPIKTAA